MSAKILHSSSIQCHRDYQVTATTVIVWSLAGNLLLSWISSNSFKVCHGLPGSIMVYQGLSRSTRVYHGLFVILGTNKTSYIKLIRHGINTLSHHYESIYRPSINRNVNQIDHDQNPAASSKISSTSTKMTSYYKKFGNHRYIFTRGKSRSSDPHGSPWISVS